MIWQISVDMMTISQLKMFYLQNGIEVKPRKDLRIYAMGRKHYFQILKCEVSDSGTYSCDAGDSSTSCNIAVYGTVCRFNNLPYEQYFDD